MSISGRGEKSVKFDIDPITFTETDANGVHFPQNDALVIEAIIGNHTVCRILVDNGRGNIIPEGVIRLHLTVSDQPHTSTFPSLIRIGQVKGTQYESQLTYSDAVHTYADLRRVPPAVEVRIVVTSTRP
ncbi:hypothetical protein TIFTF001_025156 [Ficus carica]|uniref:Uncharacterized protein n=1 Tax=Ficus carica TaxID=3494 RepID=A0AA88AYK3_FICCA|nr:hypothetical protein TIFTF001_025156 [Ficus carica]